MAKSVDVAIVGYGPVGRLLALKLGQRGYRVTVLEKRTAGYALPRAAHFDDEIARILQSVGASPDDMSEAVEPYNDKYEWRSPDGSLLLELDWTGTGPSGWNVSNFFHQPEVEQFLDGRVGTLPGVQVLRGHTVVGHTDRGDVVDVQAESADGEPITISARYVVGADGANSIVREWIGTAVTDLGYFRDWLVVDLKPNARLVFTPPASQLCDPARPTTLVPGGPGRRRFEFMRLPSETSDELGTTDAAWRLLAPWGVRPDNAEIERNIVYTFQARSCDRWRAGRLFIAGDAAHLMPPFAGQGMCSGLRDVVNLEWKLDLVLRGLAGESILDSYGTERAEHVQHFIEESMGLGAVICMTDPEEAAQRDQVLKADIEAGVQLPPRPLPRLGEWFYRHDDLSGTLAIQARVAGPSGEGRFDDIFGAGGVLLLDSAELKETLSEDRQARLADLGFRIVTLGDQPDEQTAVDTTGAYGRWFGELNAHAVLIRPDYYLWGVGRSARDLSGLVDDLLAQLVAR